MPENRRPQTAHVIDVFVSIDIPNPCAFPASNEKRVTADVAKRAHRRIYAAGDAFLCASKMFGRTRSHPRNITAESLNRQIGKSFGR